MDNLEEMNKLLEIYSLSILNQEETKYEQTDYQ